MQVTASVFAAQVTASATLQAIVSVIVVQVTASVIVARVIDASAIVSAGLGEVTVGRGNWA